MDQNEAPKLDQSTEVPPVEAEQQGPEVNQVLTSDSIANDSLAANESMPSTEPQIFTPDQTEIKSAESGSQMAGEAGPVVNGETTSSTNPAKKAGLSRLWKKVAIIAGVFVVLAGGSAAAFYAVYLPHQPWYILDTALKNSMAQNNLTIDANANLNSSSMPLKLASLTAANLMAKQLDENLTVTVAGANIPLELRLVNSNLYFKFGDLSNLAPLAGLAGPTLNDPSLGTSIKPVLTALSNQWVVVDSTLLEQSKSLKCLLSSSWALSSADSNSMVNSYLSQPFLSVKSQTADTLNAQVEDKMSVTMNDNQASKYFANLSSLDSFKSYDQCSGSKSTPSHSTPTTNQTTPLTIWINKSTHRIDKVDAVSTAGTLDATISYGNVNVQVPANAVPFIQLIAQLEQGLKGDPQLLNSVLPLLSSL